ncbi:Valine--pyruvate aminotransferase [Elasticomyces elasticus]|nr:Valine--pyruvate aminotransferase [Elasticomyces elasticus]KAK5765419.1 Valine--pyruvate aminotransferase [Elasticomyces elasticus]
MFSLDSLRNAFTSNKVRSATKANIPPPKVNDASDPPINLMRGWPSPALLPAELIRAAANEALSDTAVVTDGLLYGPDPGYEPCREAIAKWLTDFYRTQGAAPITASRICVTGGASQNLGCMLGIFTDPAYTRNIWIVAPAYMLAFRIFEDAGFAGKMKAVPEDDEGVNLAVLRRGLEESEKDVRRNGADRPMYKPDRKRAKVYKHVLYCVPTFSNPSSRTMSLEHRTELVKIAREYDMLLVADDVYDFLQWPADISTDGPLNAELQVAHLPRLVDIDRDVEGGAERKGADGFGNACANGSFSKIVGPGVRVGWVEGTEKFAYAVSQAPGYAARYRALHSAMTQHLLPLGFKLPQTDRKIFGGYFVWLSLPKSLSAEVLARRCRGEAGVIVAPGGIFEVPSNEKVVFDGFVRLCFAWEEEGRLEEGVKRIGEVAMKMLDGGDEPVRSITADGSALDKFK